MVVPVSTLEYLVESHCKKLTPIDFYQKTIPLGTTIYVFMKWENICTIGTLMYYDKEMNLIVKDPQGHNLDTSTNIPVKEDELEDGTIVIIGVNIDDVYLDEDSIPPSDS